MGERGGKLMTRVMDEQRRVRDEQRKAREDEERRREIAERFRLPVAREAREQRETPFDQYVAGMDEHDFAQRSAEASLDTNVAIAEAGEQVDDLSSWMARLIYVEQVSGGRYGAPPPVT